jgi:hypothetical protein
MGAAMDSTGVHARKQACQSTAHRASSYADCWRGEKGKETVALFG